MGLKVVVVGVGEGAGEKVVTELAGEGCFEFIGQSGAGGVRWVRLGINRPTQTVKPGLTNRCTRAPKQRSIGRVSK